MAFNYNPDVRTRADAILSLKGQEFTNIIGDQIIPIVDVTPVSSSTIQKLGISDGTDDALVSTQGELLVEPSFNRPNSSQTVIQQTSGKAGTAVTAGTGVLLYTVTSGKTLYMTQFAMTSITSGGTLELRDGTTIAGTLALGGGTGTTQQSEHFTMPTPLKFTAGVFLDVGNTGTTRWTFSGWEE